METWWNGLGLTLQILYCIAVPATLVLVIQVILLLVSDIGGGAGDADTSGLDLSQEIDPDGLSGNVDLPDDSLSDGGTAQTVLDGNSPIHLITLQTVLAFFTVFGWSSIVAISMGTSATPSLMIGICLGLLAMLLIAKLVQMSTRLNENGTLNFVNAVGQTGEVYLPIPAHQSGKGKVMVEVQGRYLECDAMTDGEALATGMQVVVTAYEDETLLVKRCDEPAQQKNGSPKKEDL